MKPSIQVAAGVLLHQGRILAAQRPPGKHLAGYWEFPGGKIEPGESPEQTLRRELQEELGIQVTVGEAFLEVTHDYPERQVQLLTFICRWPGGPLERKEHTQIRWLAAHELDSVDWAPADLPFLPPLKRLLEQESTEAPPG